MDVFAKQLHTSSGNSIEEPRAQLHDIIILHNKLGHDFRFLSVSVFMAHTRVAFRAQRTCTAVTAPSSAVDAASGGEPALRLPAYIYTA